MATQNVIQSGNDSQWRAIVIFDAGFDDCGTVQLGRGVEVGIAQSSALAMQLAQTKLEMTGPSAIGFTAERVTPIAG